MRWEEKEEAYHIYITRGTEVPVEKTASTPLQLAVMHPAAAPPMTRNPHRRRAVWARQRGAGPAAHAQLSLHPDYRSDFPKTIIFINGGLSCAQKGSPVIEELRELQNKEVEILACGTCLDYYNLKEELSAGTISNMYEIADRLMAASRVLSL